MKKQNNLDSRHGKLRPILCLALSWALGWALSVTAFSTSTAQASIIGVDDRQKITLQENEDAEFAARTPKVHYCNNSSTTGILTRIKGQNSDYMILSAHQLFNGNGKFNRYDSNKNGKIDKADKRCSLKDLRNAVVAFNLVYMNSKYDDFSKIAERDLFDGDPINLKDASNYLTTGEDALIIKLKKQISEQILPDTNKKRGYSKFLPVGKYYINALSEHSTNIAYHSDTAQMVMKSERCKVRRYNTLVDPRISFKSKCDAKPGSSNSPVFVKDNNEPAIWGLVIGGRKLNQPENAKISNWNSIKTAEFLVKEYGFETVEPAIQGRKKHAAENNIDLAYSEHLR